MSRLAFDKEVLNALVLGGSFYGGGGGGAPEIGLQAGLQALRMGHPYLVDLSDVPDDSVLLTVSAVGAPAGAGPHARPEDYARAVEVFQQYSGRKVGGLITNECGGLATVNGWIQSAVTGLPVVDAPCNGRAHPTGTMGSIGLHKVPGYVAEQVAVGGRQEQGNYLEVFIRGSVDGASGLVRRTAAQIGGLVAVARNPVEASYARENAAPGAIRKCLEVGRAMATARKGWAGSAGKRAVAAAAEASGGFLSCFATVVGKELETAGGFDVGRILLRSGPPVGPETWAAPGGLDADFELSFVNEWLTLEGGPGVNDGKGVGGGSAAGTRRTRQRLATFPDLIATLDLESGWPVSSAGVQPGQQVAVVVVPSSKLILGAGMGDRDLYAEVERVVGRDIIKYAFPQ